MRQTFFFPGSSSFNTLSFMMLLSFCHDKSPRQSFPPLSHPLRDRTLLFICVPQHTCLFSDSPPAMLTSYLN
jgi:hypothetical protein